MKHVSWIACSTLLIGLGAGPLAAQPIAVQVTGHVTQCQDNTGLVCPYAQVLAPVTATYTYDPNGPATILQFPNMYSLPPSSASIVISIGSLTFQTGPASTIQAQMYPASLTGGGYSMASFNAFPGVTLPSGVVVNAMGISFTDSTGAWPPSMALPSGAPNLASYADSSMIIQGLYTSGTNQFQINIQVDSAQLLPPSIEISPLTGSFIYQQHFDAGMLLPLGGAALATMQASIGGSPLALSYPGTCQLATPTSAGRAALVCPGADAALASFQGITQIDWLVTLADGSTYTRSVQWNLIH